MTLTRMTMTVTALLFASSLALAEDKKPAAAPGGGGPPMPTPSPELAAFMKAFEGSWKCESKFPANAFGPGSPEMTAKSTVKIKKDMGGFWYMGLYEVIKNKAMPMGMKASFNVGYDSASKQVVVLSVDSMGGMGDEKGTIQGDTLTVTGDSSMMGMKVKTRETMTKKSDKEVTHTFEVDMGKGWSPPGLDTCKK